MRDRGTTGRMRRRLRSLAVMELVNIPLQAVIWFWWVGFPITLANAAGFAVFALLLAQGAAYWLAKLRQVARPDTPLSGYRWFALARRVNVPVLAGVGTGIALMAIDDPGAGTIPGLGFAVAACLEYVNYFRTQLMYDTRSDLGHLLRHGLRRAHLARDLDVLATTSRGGMRQAGTPSRSGK